MQCPFCMICIYYIYYQDNRKSDIKITWVESQDLNALSFIVIKNYIMFK